VLLFGVETLEMCYCFWLKHWKCVIVVETLEMCLRVYIVHKKIGTKKRSVFAYIFYCIWVESSEMPELALSQITEYHTANHDSAAVVLPNLGIMYMKEKGLAEKRNYGGGGGDKNDDYYVLSNFKKCAHMTLDALCALGGDFSMSIVPPSGITTLRISTSFSGRFEFAIFEWEFSRKAFWISLLKIQRNLKVMLYARRASRSKFQVSLVKSFFQQSDWAHKLPNDIAALIIRAYFQRPPPQSEHNCVTRCVQTNSFLQLTAMRGVN